MFDKFKDALTNSEYKVNYWYNGTGTADFAAENHLEFHNRVMSEMTDVFRGWSKLCDGSKERRRT